MQTANIYAYNATINTSHCCMSTYFTSAVDDLYNIFRIFLSFRLFLFPQRPHDWFFVIKLSLSGNSQNTILHYTRRVICRGTLSPQFPCSPPTVHVRKVFAIVAAWAWFWLAVYFSLYNWLCCCFKVMRYTMLNCRNCNIPIWAKFDIYLWYSQSAMMTFCRMKWNITMVMKYIPRKTLSEGPFCDVYVWYMLLSKSRFRRVSKNRRV